MELNLWLGSCKMHFDKSLQASVAEKFWSNYGCYFIHFLWPVIMRNWGAYEVPEWRSWAWFDQNPPHHLVFIFGQDSDDSRCGLHHLTWADTGLISIFLHVIMLGKCLRNRKSLVDAFVKSWQASGWERYGLYGSQGPFIPSWHFWRQLQDSDQTW